MTERARTKAEVLDGLEEKITAAQIAVEETRRAAATFEQGIQSRVKDDAVGGPKYPASDQREDSGVLVGLEQEARDAAKAHAVLESLLPAARADAAIEQLEAVSRGLKESDANLLAPALGAFRKAWNSMLGALAETEQAFRDRSILEGEFTTARDVLPEAEKATLFPPAPSLSHAGLRNLLTVRVGDSSRFLAGLARFVIQEADMRGLVRAPDARD